MNLRNLQVRPEEPVEVDFLGHLRGAAVELFEQSANAFRGPLPSQLLADGAYCSAEVIPVRVHIATQSDGSVLQRHVPRRRYSLKR